MTHFTVEPLPPRPSLEHQQKLAKRLLRDCWAGKADAIARVQAFLPGSPNLDALKLHDAQVVIANKEVRNPEWTVEARIVAEAPASGVDKPADWRVVGVDLVTARSGPVQPGAPGVRPGGF